MVFPLSWMFLFTNEALAGFLLIESFAALFGIAAIIASGVLADRFGHRRLLYWGAMVITAFGLVAPLLLARMGTAEAIDLVLGFAILGVIFGQSSGAVASMFEPRLRYTGSALVSDLSWMLSAGFAPLAALALTEWGGLILSGLYLLSGAVCTMVVLMLPRRIEMS